MDACGLIIGVSKNFSHSKMANKSQTRKFNMSPLFYAVGTSNALFALQNYYNFLNYARNMDFLCKKISPNASHRAQMGQSLRF